MVYSFSPKHKWFLYWWKVGLGKNRENLVFKTQQIRTSLSRNSNLLTIESWLSERYNYPCSPHPFKLISYHTNPRRLLWPFPFIIFFLQHNPLFQTAYYTLCNSAHGSNELLLYVGPKYLHLPKKIKRWRRKFQSLRPNLEWSRFLGVLIVPTSLLNGPGTLSRLFLL